MSEGKFVWRVVKWCKAKFGREQVEKAGGSQRGEGMLQILVWASTQRSLKLKQRREGKDKVHEGKDPLWVFNSILPLPIYQGKWLALMGQNDVQCLAETICLHMLWLMSLPFIMGYSNEVRSVMREPVKIINCSQDPINREGSSGKMMYEWQGTDNQRRQKSILNALLVYELLWQKREWWSMV